MPVCMILCVHIFRDRLRLLCKNGLQPKNSQFTSTSADLGKRAIVHQRIAEIRERFNMAIKIYLPTKALFKAKCSSSL